MAKNPFFEDFTKLAGSAMDQAFTSMHDMKKIIEDYTRHSVEQTLKKMNVVTREELEVVKAMAEKARKENMVLQKRVDQLENPTISTKSKAKSSK